MKRIITLALVAVMLVSSMVFSTNAAGTLLFSDNFDTGFIPRNWITERESCHFVWDSDNGCITGYDDSVVLQSNYGNKYNRWWDTFYASMDFQIRDFDDFKPEHEGRTHTVGMWYRDRFDVPATEQTGAVYEYKIEIETGKATLNKSHTWNYYDDNGVKQEATTNTIIAEGQIDETIRVAQRAPYYSIGMRVTEGKIECFFQDKVVITAEADPEDTKYGDYTMNSVDESLGSTRGPILFLNGGNYIAFDNFEVWTPDYDFTSSVVYGDADGDGDVKLGDVSLMLKHIAGWSDLTIDLTAADVDVNGSVNLTDASTTLKVIAGWEGVVLGPQA